MIYIRTYVLSLHVTICYISLCVGFTTVTGPVYVAELVPNHIRGKLVFLSYVMTGGGVLAGAVVGGIFSVGGHHFTETYGWR